MNKTLILLLLLICGIVTAEIILPPTGGGGGQQGPPGSVTNAQPPNASLTNLADNGFTTISNSTVLWVDTGGNDTTAIRGRQDKPWLRLTNAIKAAVAGDLVYVRSGTYTDTNNAITLLKNGVNWHFEKGAIINSGRGDDAIIEAPLFNDWSGSVTSTITGWGVFTVSNTLCGVANITNNLSKINWSFETIRAANQQAAIIQGQSDLRLIFTDKIQSDGYDAFINEATAHNVAKLYMVGPSIIGDTQAGDSCIELGASFNPGDCYIRTRNAQGDLSITDGADISLGSLYLGGSCTIYYRSNMVGSGILRDTFIYGTSNATTPIISTPSPGLFHTSGLFDNCYFRGATNLDIALITNSAAKITFKDCVFQDGFGATNSIRSRNAQSVRLIGINHFVKNTPLHANVTVENYGTNWVKNLRNDGTFTNAGLASFGGVISAIGGLDASSDVNILAGNFTASPGVVTDIQGDSFLRGVNLPNLTASRPLILNASGDVTNAVGTPDGTKFLRDDGTLAVPPGTGGGGTNFPAAIIATNLITGQATASANTINALRGDYQIVNLGAHTNMNYVPYPGQESNVWTTVMFTQNSTGGYYPTNNGITLYIPTNANAVGFARYGVYNGVTNVEVAISTVLTNPIGGQTVLYDGTNGVFRNSTAPTGGSSISTNTTQFGPSVELTLRTGLRTTNIINYGVQTNVSSTTIGMGIDGPNLYSIGANEFRFGVNGTTNWAVAVASGRSGSLVPADTNAFDLGSFFNTVRTNWVNDLVAKETVSSDLVYANAVKYNIWTNYVNTVSNFVFNFNTNRIELKNQTNIIFTNIVEEATASGADMTVHIHNTTGVTMGLVWPAYGAQHGYYFQTNVNNPIISTTSLAAGAHGIASFTAFGTNIFATFTTWP